MTPSPLGTDLTPRSFSRWAWIAVIGILLLALFAIPIFGGWGQDQEMAHWLDDAERQCELLNDRLGRMACQQRAASLIGEAIDRGDVPSPFRP